MLRYHIETVLPCSINCTLNKECAEKYPVNGSCADNINQVIAGSIKKRLNPPTISDNKISITSTDESVKVSISEGGLVIDADNFKSLS